MIRFLKNQNLLLTVSLSLLAFFAKLLFCLNAMPLDDEIYYYLWSKKPDFGYPEHGPFLPWIYSMITQILDESPLTIRIFGLLGMLILSVYMFFFMHQYFDLTTAWIAFLIYNLIPITFALSVISTIDTPMFIFGTFSLIFYFRGFFEKTVYLYPGGIFLGFAALSKVSAIFLGLGLLFFIVLSIRRRDHIINPHIWISFFLAALIYSPFLIWNYLHGFPFFVNARMLLSRDGSVETFLFFWLSQTLLIFPTFFALIIHALGKTFSNHFRKNENEKTLFFSSIGTLSFFYIFYQSIDSKLESNWGGFAYISLLFLVCIYLGQLWQKKWMRSVFSSSLLISGCFMLLVLTHILFDVFPIQLHDITNRYHRYKPFNDGIKKYYETELDPGIRTISFNNYQIPSMLEYYVNPELKPLSINDKNYHPVIHEYWYSGTNLSGKDLYFLGGGNSVPNFIFHLCEETLKLEDFYSKRQDAIIAQYSVHLCKNFEGNIRPLPTL